MYEDYLIRKRVLEKKQKKLIEEINNKKNTDYNALQQLMQVTAELQEINSCIFTATRSLCFEYKNYELLMYMKNLLKLYKEGKWNIVTIEKEDANNNEYIFICLSRGEINPNDYSLEFLVTQLHEGNYLQHLLIYDAVECNEKFDMDIYMLRKYADIENYITPGYYFSPHYPFLQEFILNKLDQNIEYVHQKRKQKSRKNLPSER